MYNLLVWGMGRVSQGSRGGHQSLHPANTPHFPLSTYLVTNWLSISLSVLIRATGNWLLHPGTISTWELKASESLVTLVVMWGHCIVTSVRTVARRWPWRSPDWYLIVIIVISLKALCPSSPQSDHRLIHSNKSFVNVDPVNTQHLERKERRTGNSQLYLVLAPEVVITKQQINFLSSPDFPRALDVSQSFLVLSSHTQRVTKPGQTNLSSGMWFHVIFCLGNFSTCHDVTVTSSRLKSTILFWRVEWNVLNQHKNEIE